MSGRYRAATTASVQPYDTRTHGPRVMRLTPQGHTAQGRSGFLIHGDRTHTASEGCVILDRTVRTQISRSSDSRSPSAGGTAPDRSSPHAQATPPAAGPATRDPALRRIAARAATQGPHAFLGRISEQDVDWRHLLDRMADGDAAAMAIARQLRPAADAGSAEALDTAAALGLPRAPGAVLGMIAAGANADMLCTSPFIEPEPGVEKRYSDAAIKALDRMPTARRPQPAFDRCHRNLTRIAAQSRQD